jgi:hypothetical protein
MRFLGSNFKLDLFNDIFRRKTLIKFDLPYKILLDKVTKLDLPYKIFRDELIKLDLPYKIFRNELVGLGMKLSNQVTLLV